MPVSTNVRLSICIATFRRGGYIAATLASIVPQLDDTCELVIVDGASPDQTSEAVRPFTSAANVRYVRESTNSGIDRDYDKAVGYARGEYCWLMTDDDLLVAGAVQRVLAALDDAPDLLVVNAEVRTIDLSHTLKAHLLSFNGPNVYGSGDEDALLAEVGRYLTFIGGTVIRRSLWLQRNKEKYYGSLFIHVGVIFQAPIASARVLREPQVLIRYGNAMWTSRTFEIWMFKWPELVWSFSHLSSSARRKVTASEPFRSPRNLLWYRGTGGYGTTEYENALRAKLRGPSRLLASAVSRMSSKAANAICGAYCWLRLIHPPLMAIYDLSRAESRASLSVALARRLDIH